MIDTPSVVVTPTQLPVKIEICPIREVIAELRFTTDVPSEAVFGYVHRAVHHEYPKVTPIQPVPIPTENAVAEASLRYRTHFRLEGEGFMVLLGPLHLSLACVGDYPGWSDFKERALELIRKVSETGLIKLPTRYGLRYINFFKGDVLEQLTLRIELPGTDTRNQNTHLKQTFTRDGCKLLIQIANQTLLAPPSNLGMGTVVDLDASFQPNPADASLNRHSEFFEKVHTAEKELFYGLLKPDFLNSLKPVY